MEAMSIGERRRIMTLYDKGWSTSRIAEAMGRSESGVRRVRQHFRERGHIQPLPRGQGRKPKVPVEGRQVLADLVEAQPDLTIDQYHEQSGLAVSRATIDRYLRAMKVSFKKKSSTPRSRIARMSQNDASPGN